MTVVVNGRDDFTLENYRRVSEGGEPVAGDDAAEAAWVPLSEVEALPLVDGLADFLHDHGILATFS